MAKLDRPMLRFLRILQLILRVSAPCILWNAELPIDTKTVVAVVNGKVVQTVTMEDKVISKQSDSEWCHFSQDEFFTNLSLQLSMLHFNTSTPAMNAIPAPVAVVHSLATVSPRVLVSKLEVHADIALDITNLTVTLSEADTNFANVMSLDSVTDSNFKSTDGGITWHTDRITVSSIDFDSSSDTEVN